MHTKTFNLHKIYARMSNVELYFPGKTDISRLNALRKNLNLR